MKKNCSRYPPASRADTGTFLSRRFSCRKSEFRPEGDGSETDMIDEADDSVFLMNRFYGEKIILPMIECVRKEFAGEVGLTVARRLEKEMLEKNGFIRGDDLVELLKDGLGLECAVSLIGQMDRFRKMGLYGDRIVTSLPKPSVEASFLSDGLPEKRQRQPVKTDCAGKEGTCRGCVPKKVAKEKMNWKKNAKTK